MALRQANWGSLHAIGREHRRGRRGRFAYKKPEIEPRFFQSAGGGGKREAARNV
jgi:hypothetical protein